MAFKGRIPAFDFRAYSLVFFLIMSWFKNQSVNLTTRQIRTNKIKGLIKTFKALNGFVLGLKKSTVTTIPLHHKYIIIWMWHQAKEQLTFCLQPSPKYSKIEISLEKNYFVCIKGWASTTKHIMASLRGRAIFPPDLYLFHF